MVEVLPKAYLDLAWIGTTCEDSRPLPAARQPTNDNPSQLARASRTEVLETPLELRAARSFQRSGTALEARLPALRAARISRFQAAGGQGD